MSQISYKPLEFPIKRTCGNAKGFEDILGLGVGIRSFGCKKQSPNPHANAGSW